jgi:hypothetical protein
MTTGVFFKQQPGANAPYSWQNTGAATSVRVTAFNPGPYAARVRIAIGAPSSTPGATEWDVRDEPIRAGQRLEPPIPPAIVDSNKFVVVQSDSGNVIFTASGTE